MKTDSAARLYSQQFLRIVELQKAATSPLRVVKPEAKPVHQRITDLSSNPAHWDERWFANYE